MTGIGKGAAGQQTVLIAQELGGAADQSDPLGMAAVAFFTVSNAGPLNSLAPGIDEPWARESVWACREVFP